MTQTFGKSGPKKADLDMDLLNSKVSFLSFKKNYGRKHITFWSPCSDSSVLTLYDGISQAIVKAFYIEGH